MKTNTVLMGLIVLLLLGLIFIMLNPTIIREYIPVVTSPDVVYVRDGPWWGGGLPWGFPTKPWGAPKPPPPPPAEAPPPPSPPAEAPPPPPPAEAPPPPMPLGFLDMSKAVESFGNYPWNN